MSSTISSTHTAAAGTVDTVDAVPVDVRTAGPRRNAVAVIGGVAMLATAPLFFFAGLTSPPQRSDSDLDYVASLSVDAGRTALSAQLYHYGWVATIFGAVAALGLVARGRGRALTIVGALVSVFGSVQISGLLLGDYFNGAAGRIVGNRDALAVFDSVQNASGVGIWYASSFIAILGTPLLLGGLARARQLPWWLLPLSVVGMVVPFFVNGTAGLALGAVGFVPGIWIGVLLLRSARRA